MINRPNEYRLKGQLDALQGKPCYYGPHFGMRSSYAYAKEEYRQGWLEVDYYLTHGDTE
jgi:hypothetical protein